ncbi:hypothetical protein [Arthrobacter sp. Helios]|uniref:hypothetical protein n=1 Tax=Arthrobacter sp. Helios TaxID=2828862 RepID=UPI00206B97E9|nr:hypothetical protein [Arthrobacter sp. Helios]UPO76029.1 hypothetical protein ArtHe_11760 [Arthrobacter sp. Helios]
MITRFSGASQAPDGGRHPRRLVYAAALAALTLTTGLVSASAAQPETSKKIPQLSAAQPGTLEECAGLVSFDYGTTTIARAEIVPAAELTNAGTPVGEHCLVQGR